MRLSTFVLATAFVVLSGIGNGEGLGAEHSAGGGENTRTKTRELFQAAGRLYRFERPVTLSSGAYRCLAEDLRQFDHPQATEQARYLLEKRFGWHELTGDQPKTKHVLALLDEDSPEVRMAASIWLCQRNDLWWIERLDPPLRDKLEGRLLTTFRKQLRHETQSLRCEAAQALTELKTDRALTVLIDTLEDPQFGHASDVVYGVQTAFRWPNISGGRLRLPGGEYLSLSTDWPRDTVVSLLKQLVDLPGGKQAFYAVRDIRVIPRGPDPVDWSGLPPNDKERQFRECIEKLRSDEADDRVNAVCSLGHSNEPRVVEPLLFASRDTVPHVRAEAAWSLARTGDERAVAMLRLLSKDRNAQVRGAAISALAGLDDSAAIGHLIAALEDDDEQVRADAADDLADAPGSAVTDALAKVLIADRNEDVRLAAIRALGKRKDRRAFEAVLAALDDDDGPVRWAAVDALGDLGDIRALRPLLAVASTALDNTAYYRNDALAAIGRLPKDQVRQLVLDELNRDSVDTRWGAVLALGLVREPRSVGPLLEALKQDDPLLRQCVIWALMRLEDERAVVPLIAELRRELSWSRVDAAIALGRLADRRAVRPLCGTLADRDALVRLASAVALGMLADNEAVESLVEALSDEDSRVVTAAAESLALIGDRRAIKPLEERLMLAPLFALGWKPSKSSDCLRLFWIGANNSLLAALAEESKPWLRKLLQSDDPRTRFQAASVLIRIGDEKTLPALISMLEKHGTDGLACVYNSSGKQELIAAARSWAGRHTGSIERRSPSVQWGGVSKSVDFSRPGGTTSSHSIISGSVEAVPSPAGPPRD